MFGKRQSEQDAKSEKDAKSENGQSTVSDKRQSEKDAKKSEKDAKRHREAAVDYGRPAIVRIPEREAGAAGRYLRIDVDGMLIGLSWPDDAGRGIPPPPSFPPPGPPMPEDPAPKHRKVGPEQLDW